MPRMMGTAALMLILSGAASAAEPPRLVASLPPLHGLASAVMEGIGEPDLLVRSGGSEHAYALRPSDARALAAADLVVWVGPGLETFLAKSIASLARPDAVLTLSALPSVTVLPRRTGEGWGGADEEHAEEAHAHEESGEREEHEENEEHEAGHDEHAHEHGAEDLHLWLDPDNALAIVAAIADRLSAIDPDRAQRYRENAARMAERIGALDAELMRRLEPVREVPFLVFHDAYQYFEGRYGLSAVGAVVIDPERPPGAQHLADLRGRIAASEARCIFAEPQFKPDLVERLREGTALRAGTLDPLGADLPPGSGHYEAMMRALAASLVGCLGGG